MSHTKQLEELCDSKNLKISAWAKDILDLEMSYKSNKISESEYKELLQDLVHSKNISDSSIELKEKSKLNECIKNIISVAGLASIVL
jgi:polyhydroxyalkanoate synthesis regulator phasin